MSGTTAFDLHAARYDEWFERHPAVHQSEILALREFLPTAGFGLEIGVGGARFAAPLGISVGLDPSMAMLRHAQKRGIEVVAGRAEVLPFRRASFDGVLIVTTLCFVDSPREMLREAGRILKPNGRLVIGFVDRDSPLGRDYLAHQAESEFYLNARFHSAIDVQQLLQETDFRIVGWGQTLRGPAQETSEVEAVEDGYGRGAFVVVAAEKRKTLSGRGEA